MSEQATTRADAQTCPFCRTELPGEAEVCAQCHAYKAVDAKRQPLELKLKGYGFYALAAIILLVSFYTLFVHEVPIWQSLVFAVIAAIVAWLGWIQVRAAYSEPIWFRRR